ncbi:MAG: Ribose ABC transport system, ATP-binding protein RbsA, partial [uncultured Thermomicrobiales bacterium]
GGGRQGALPRRQAGHLRRADGGADRDGDDGPLCRHRPTQAGGGRRRLHLAL